MYVGKFCDPTQLDPTQLFGMNAAHDQLCRIDRIIFNRRLCAFCIEARSRIRQSQKITVRRFNEIQANSSLKC